MPRRAPHPFGLSPMKTDCLLEAARTGLLVPGERGRFRRRLAGEEARSFHGITVASLIADGLLERSKGRAVAPTREGLALARKIEGEIAPRRAFDSMRSAAAMAHQAFAKVGAQLARAAERARR